ncbi:MAG: peroxidase family protein [Solirubrobacteraceae bacterium]
MSTNARVAAWRAAGALAIAISVAAPAVATGRATNEVLRFQPRSLNGSGNNLTHPTWGEMGSEYQRLTPAHYADGAGAMAAGPNPRYVSNRIFNSLGVDLFSEHNVSQWVWVWGQFLDHTFGLAESGTDDAGIPFDSSDPLESFTNTLGPIPFDRDAVAPGTGTSRSDPRQQVNTVNSYIDGWPIYGGTQQRLAWLRTGPDDGNPAEEGADLLLPGGYLPQAGARGNVGSAPSMQLNGALLGDPGAAVVSGDVRANENAELTAVHTLFAREHNRIVGLLPRSMPAEERFQIARRVVGAEEQYITYTEFLPSVGVTLPAYRGYRSSVDPELYDEFATVGYRAHSIVNGEEHVDVPAARYTPAQLATLQAMGVTVSPIPRTAQVQLDVSQGAAFFNPALVPDVGLGPLLAGLGDEPGYKNDEQIDDALRSVLFEVPGADMSDPSACYDDPATAGCFQGVVDLGAIDIQRSRDHGMPTYNQLRQAVGLPRVTSFTQLTGESTDAFAARLGPNPIDNPASLDFTKLRDLYGRPIAPGSSARAVFGTRASTLAARLKAIYGSVDNVDAFVGMMSEPHMPGAEFGPLQLALWRKQFTALRDGDRFFYFNDPVLGQIQRMFGITYKHTLAQLIALNTDVPSSSLRANLFFTPAPAQATPSLGG